MQSAIKHRPRTLDELVGQEKVVRLIRGQVKKKLLSNALMFTGHKGSGKTSIARILALSVQCSHQTKFGHPCKLCRKNTANLPIYEINCGKIRGVQELEQFIATAEYEIVGRGKRKVFILDEAHRLSGHAQDTLLIPTEKKNKNLWIINTTKEDKIIETLRSRFQIYHLRGLNRDYTTTLVGSLLAKLNSELSIDDITDALVDNGITSARLITNAVDKYVSGASAEDAAMVAGTASVDSKALIRAAIKGSWADVTMLLKKTSPGDVRFLRNSTILYLNTILLDSVEINDRTEAISEAIKRLSYVSSAEDVNQLSALGAELFAVCKLFANYNL